jgi:lipopolysaccharide transport system ATP-binding protein
MALVRTTIGVEHLSKRYLIGSEATRYVTFRETLTRAIKSPLRRFKQAAAGVDGDHQEFWALRDVSFELKRGDVVGVIGHNGAGKSTLLKILSRITDPTEGRIKLSGRVASLLEVGTGFHQELTGRENIFLNGSVLGMSRAEIKRKFDAIVSFSEVEKFLDTPVKRYSSGMYMRLAFAIAAHVDPDILIVDEVLAVGDAAFQQKCVRRMTELTKAGGPTILFVSHNHWAVLQLCRRGLVLEKGRLLIDAEVAEALKFYSDRTRATPKGESNDDPHVLYRRAEPSPLDFAVSKVEMFEKNGDEKGSLATWDDVKFRFTIVAKQPLPSGKLYVDVKTMTGHRALRLASSPDGNLALTLKPGENVLECEVERFPLSAGEYVVGWSVNFPLAYSPNRDEEAFSFKVEPKDVFASGTPPTVDWAFAVPSQRWSTV